MLNKVSQQVITAVLARIADPTTGFNPGIATNAAIYGLNTCFISINWSNTSINFYQAQIDPELLEKSGLLKYPFACLYTKESGVTNDQKFTQFSGLVRVVLEFHMSWTQIKGLQNHEAYGNCVEDVVFDVINRVENQNWGKPLTYNGQIQCKRGPLIYGAQNFKQVIGFSMMFQVDQ
jgi:hypothetical protein